MAADLVMIAVGLAVVVQGNGVSQGKRIRLLKHWLQYWNRGLSQVFRAGVAGEVVLFDDGLRGDAGISKKVSLAP